MDAIVMSSVQYSALPQIDEVRPLEDEDYDVLQGIRDVLLRHGATERFGVCLLHRHFDVAEDECAVETTDIVARTSAVTVEKRDATDGPFIPTMWKFEAGEGIRAGTVCVLQCYYNSGHAQVHVPVGV